MRFKPGTAASERQSLNAAQNADVRRALLVPRAYLLRLPNDRDVRAAQRAYERNPNVQYAEPNYVGELFATPNDQFYTQSPFRMWAMHNTGQNFGAGPGTADADIDAPEAWDITTGSSAVTVGIADTGIDYNHPDLAGNIWHNPGESGGGKETNGLDDDGNGKVDDFRGWDFVENDNDPQDDESHGSHVAGTVGAVGNDGLGVPGVNWTVRVAALRVCSPDLLVQCSTANQADAFAYAGQKGMKAVNGSFGSNFSQTVADAIANAPNTLFVFAAGNGGADGVGDNNDTAPVYPCQYPAPNIICVAATDHNDNLASFSNYGMAGVDLAAPGVNILSTYPDVVRFRENFQAADFGTKWTTGGTNNTWARICGANCLMTDSPAGNYQNNTDSTARTTAAFDLSNMADCRAQYLMVLDTEFANDAIYVEGSTDATTWSFVQGWTGGTGSNFMFFNENLSAFDGLASVYLRYRMVTNASVTADGAYIDEIVVRCKRNGYPVGSTGWQFSSGTSMASPHVAGAVALAFAKEPGASALAVKNSILDGVDKKAALQGVVGSAGRLNLFGMLTDLAGGHARPIAASPIQASLVPAHAQCTSPNRVHGPPDLPGGTNPDGSCHPPAAVSGQATMGTPDANTASANFVGSVRYSVIVGVPGAPDDSDVRLTTSLTDVRCRPTGSRCGAANAAGPADYNGELRATVNVRMTDKWNATAPGGGPDSATLQDQAIGRSFACVQSVSTGTGSSCTLNTTLNALAPGLVRDTKRAVWQLEQVQVYDGGADGDADTAAGNTLYAVQGLFVP